MIVDLTPTEEQRLVDDSVRSLLAGRLPLNRLRDPSNHAAAAESALWADFAALGIFGLGLAQSDGGVGYGLAEEVIVARALGEYLASPLLISQMSAVHLASEGSLRAKLIAGEVRAALVHALDGGEGRLIDAAGATFAVTLTGGARLVPLAAFEGREPVAGLDETVHVERLIGPMDARADPVAAHRISLLLAAYLVGVASAARDMAVGYASTREQFGQPIGAFQAIKHSCADMAVRAAAADSQTCYAAVTFGLGGDNAVETACARYLAREAALANAQANIQVHGGMGFTADCDAHLLLKRAHLVGAIASSRRQEQSLILGSDGAQNRAPQ